MGIENELYAAYQYASNELQGPPNVVIVPATRKGEVKDLSKQLGPGFSGFMPTVDGKEYFCGMLIQYAETDTIKAGYVWKT